MNQFDQLLTAIASEHLDIPTLKTRRSDSLDFHTVSVWGIRAALKAAFDAGAKAAPAAPELLDALRLAQGALNAAPRFRVGDTDSYRIAATVDAAIAKATAARPASTPSEPWSVLLLYPDYINDRGDETYYAFVEASDAIEAVALAQKQAVAAQEGVDTDPDDFAPLLVTEGHHASQPLFNQ